MSGHHPWLSACAFVYVLEGHTSNLGSAAQRARRLDIAGWEVLRRQHYVIKHWHTVFPGQVGGAQTGIPNSVLSGIAHVEGSPVWVPGQHSETCRELVDWFSLRSECQSTFMSAFCNKSIPSHQVVSAESATCPPV
jgi:hypothetical protein